MEQHTKHTGATDTEPLSAKETEVIQDLVNCALACESCASACLHESNVNMMVRCAELARDCAEICFLGSRLIMRKSEHSQQFLKACEEACRVCADECHRHREEHCEICAEACESCANSCREFYASPNA